MTMSLRCLLRLGLLGVLVIGIAAGAWASDDNDVPEPGDTTQLHSDLEGTNRAYTSPLLTPAAAFINDGASPSGFFFSFGAGSVAGDDGLVGSACMYAPVYVPVGATITHFYANVVDNNVNDNLNCVLRRVNKDSGAVTTVASVVSDGADTNIDTLNTDTITNPLVDWEHAYFVTVCLRDSTEIYNTRIYFTGP